MISEKFFLIKGKKWYILKMFKKKILLPVKADHVENSLIMSRHDEKGSPTTSLIDLCLKAINGAFTIDLSNLSKRLKKPPCYPDIFPGEHYKLLSSFVKLIEPKVVVEIGTATGLSALALKQSLPANGEVHTFDLFSWENDENTVLKREDFLGLTQHCADITDDKVFQNYKNLLKEAELIFIDATHDGKLEKNILDKLLTIDFNSKPYLIFDDIRVWTMLSFWREITLPKLDITSFGHWSGTGVVELA